MFGEWWIEDRDDLEDGSYELPERRVAGNLDADGSDGWTFETIGSVGSESLHAHIGSSSNHGLGGPAHIWGINAAGESFSLLNCYATRTTVRFGNVSEGTQVWRVNAIAEGTNLWVTPDTLVDRITVRFSDLAEWAADASKLGAEWDEVEDGIVLKVSLVPNDHEATVHDCPVLLTWQKSAPVTAGDFSVSLDASLGITSHMKLSEIAAAWLYPLGRLLSLLTLSEPQITSIRVRMADSEHNGHSEYFGLRLPQRERIQQAAHREQGPVGRQLDMMATRSDLEQIGLDFDSMLQAHFALEADDRMRDTLSHFLNSQTKGTANDIDEALRCLFNAIENYHTARFDDVAPDEPALADEIDRVVKCSARRHRGEIANRLKGRRQKSIKAKLQDFVDSCGQTAQRIPYDETALIEDACEARNELAHTNPTTANRWKRDEILRAMQWLMRHALLRELGLTDEQSDTLIHQAGRPFRQDMRRN